MKFFSVALVLICGFFLGFGDSCWNTQIYSFLIAEYPNQSAEAFSCYKFFHVSHLWMRLAITMATLIFFRFLQDVVKSCFQAMVTCAAFFWSKYIQLHWHFIILCSAAIWGCICFFVSEKFLGSKSVVSKNKQARSRFSPSLTASSVSFCFSSLRNLLLVIF